jgi:hypothetical protein
MVNRYVMSEAKELAGGLGKEGVCAEKGFRPSV